MANEYNVSPLLGLALPRGVPHVVPVTITNPHDDILVVREVFTTEDFLSLQGMLLPGGRVHSGGGGGGGGTRDPAVLPVGHEWEIAPGETRELLSLSVMSMDAGTHNGYVHIKTDRDNLVIPVNAKVSAGGISSRPSKVDFGDMVSADDEASHEVWVFNSGLQDIAITDMYHKADPGLTLTVNSGAEERVGALARRDNQQQQQQEQQQDQAGSGSGGSGGGSSNKVAYKTLFVIPAGTEMLLATLLYSSSSPGRYKGKVVILGSHPITHSDGTTKATARLEIPYRATGGPLCTLIIPIFVARIRSTTRPTLFPLLIQLPK